MNLCVISCCRTLFKRFDIIVPVLTISPEVPSARYDSATQFSPPPPLQQQQQTTFSSHEDFYLVSSLLSPVEIPNIPQMASAGFVRLERKFVLGTFVPPGLMQRIMAKTFFQFGSDPSARHNPTQSSKNCWKNAFFQSFQSGRTSIIDVWVWLEVDKGFGGQVKIAGFGNLFSSQAVVAYLDFYCGAISEILFTFPELCSVNFISLCPVCATLHQRPDGQCGVFTNSDLRKLSDDLDGLKKCKLYGADYASVGKESENQMDEEEVQLMSWQDIRGRCRENGCNVRADLLTIIPRELLTTKTVAERHEQTISFLMEEIVRLSATPSTAIKKGICKIGIGYTTSDNVESFLNMVRSKRRKETENTQSEEAFPDSLFTIIDSEKASAVLTRVPWGKDGLEDRIVAISCEHFMSDLNKRVHLPKCPQGEEE